MTDNRALAKPFVPATMGLGIVLIVCSIVWPIVMGPHGSWTPEQGKSYSEAALELHSRQLHSRSGANEKAKLEQARVRYKKEKAKLESARGFHSKASWVVMGVGVLITAGGIIGHYVVIWREQ